MFCSSKELEDGKYRSSLKDILRCVTSREKYNNKKKRKACQTGGGSLTTQQVSRQVFLGPRWYTAVPAASLNVTLGGDSNRYRLGHNMASACLCPCDYDIKAMTGQ